MISQNEALSPAEAATLGPEGEIAVRESLEALEANLRTLPDKPEETAFSALRALWHLAAGERVSATEALARPLTALDTDARALFASLVRQRLEGTPLAHLTERQRFMDMEMIAGRGALIPRRETEIVARTAVRIARRLADERGNVTFHNRGNVIMHDRGNVIVMDVCTGSGNVAVAVAVAEPRAVVYAADLSEDAVALAQHNVEHLGVADRVTLRTGDLLAPFDTPEHVGKVDLLTCNPPYISSGRVGEMPTEISQHEPRLAFDGGPLGVRILQRLIREAPRMLRPGGWLAFEVGLGQGRSVAQRLKAGPYVDVESVADDNGEARVLIARTPPPDTPTPQ